MQSHWAVGEVLHKPAEVLKEIMGCRTQADSALCCGVPEHFLQWTKESLAAWKGKHHTAKFPQGLVPLLGQDSFLVQGYGLEQLL